MLSADVDDDRRMNIYTAGVDRALYLALKLARPMKSIIEIVRVAQGVVGHEIQAGKVSAGVGAGVTATCKPLLDVERRWLAESAN